MRLLHWYGCHYSNNCLCIRSPYIKHMIYSTHLHTDVIAIPIYNILVIPLLSRDSTVCVHKYKLLVCTTVRLQSSHLRVGGSLTWISLTKSLQCSLTLCIRFITYLCRTKVASYMQELMSHPKGGKGAFNYVVTALSKVLAVL